MTLAPIRTYIVRVGDFDPGYYSARSAAKARAQAYRAYCSSFDTATFKGFLKLRLSVKVTSDPPGVGRRVMIDGRPATSVIRYGTLRPEWISIGYMRDDSDVIFTAHDLDVRPLDEPQARAAVAAAAAAAAEGGGDSP